jgi:alanine racemase
VLTPSESSLEASIVERAMRPSWVEIDLRSLARNVALIKSAVGPSVKLFAVCKGDGYGCGAAVVAGIALQAGADAIAVGNPTEAAAVRQAGISAPILLYACSLPTAAAAVVRLGVIPTIHDMHGIHAFAGLDRRMAAFVKVDTGFARLGFGRREWKLAFSELARTPRVELAGIYTHFYSPEDVLASSRQLELFEEACRLAEASGFFGFDRMVASSRVIAMHPDFSLTAVNPGRALFGLWDDSWGGRVGTSPVIVAVKAQAIQVGDISPGDGRYDSPLQASRPRRAAVIPVGYADGLPQDVGNATALVAGRRVRLLSTHLEHTVVDVSTVSGVDVGDEVVLLGRQGAEAINAEALAASYSMPMLELLTRLASRLPRVYLR